MSQSPPPVSSPVRARLEAKLAATERAVLATSTHLPVIQTMAGIMTTSLQDGGCLFTAGNGGSAAQALHLSEELIGRYEATRPPIRSVPLVSDPCTLTCIANDFGFEAIFERPLRGLARAGDVLLVMSTSGNSDNIIRVLQAARELEVRPLGLLGRDGGAAAELCEHALVVEAGDSATIQDIHQLVIHLFCEAIEHTLFGSE